MLTGEHLSLGYDVNGMNALPSTIAKRSDYISDRISKPQHLEWEMTEGLSRHIAIGKKTLTDMTNDLNLNIIINDYGSGLIKKFKCSPDSFAQCALQLAYYLTHNTFVQTYESAMTRFYKLGRTETIRSACIEMAEFCKSMLDASSTNEERMKLLYSAVGTHGKLTKVG